MKNKHLYTCIVMELHTFGHIIHYYFSRRGFTDSDYDDLRDMQYSSMYVDSGVLVLL